MHLSAARPQDRGRHFSAVLALALGGGPNDVQDDQRDRHESTQECEYVTDAPMTEAVPA